MSTAQNASYAAGLAMSPPPPSDLGSYARSMHQHTKRQMDSISQASTSPERGSPSQSNDRSSGTNSMPNGVSNRRTNPGEYNYQ
ncbi:hypothetical protein QBC40DRAFT_13099 [Triangularia verruculosa]|uniref:Uncharacterized protein n=1 Tax=Triangularia verruculosa TaxID=2587418 RepID=A0AAN6XQI8_9PEZI|nr:hypothetical protein QBC40DRAFT_13099 [Triangularia verruculosa]